MLTPRKLCVEGEKSLVIDGQEVKNVRRIVVEIEVGKLPTITVTRILM